MRAARFAHAASQVQRRFRGQRGVSGRGSSAWRSRRLLVAGVGVGAPAVDLGLGGVEGQRRVFERRVERGKVDRRRSLERGQLDAERERVGREGERGVGHKVHQTFGRVGGRGHVAAAAGVAVSAAAF